MNSVLTSCLIFCTFLSAKIFARVDVIYGSDDRVEIYESTDLQQKLALGAASLIENRKINIDKKNPNLFQISQETLEDILGRGKDSSDKSKTPFCVEERFVNQPSAGQCSGFLIGPDLLVTAGHCVQLENFCQGHKWVFDFKVSPNNLSAGVDVKAENVYSCKRVVSTSLNMRLSLDYGLVQLDRVVSGRTPLEVRTKGKIADDSKLFLIGNPAGVPLKIISGGSVRKNTHPFFFTANLDSFEGNSGGAVFDEATGLVEGILVRGEQDFKFNPERKCRESNRCTDAGCAGEDSTRITAIPEIGLYNVFHKAALRGDVEKLNTITKQNFWIDFYGPDGRSALIKAALHSEAGSLSFLLSKGAEIGLKDVSGETALHVLARNYGPAYESALKVLYEGGAKLEDLNNSLETPLLVAARLLNLESVKSLIALGANKNARNAKGETILFAFARDQNSAAVEELKALGVDESVRSLAGLTYLEASVLKMASN